jgi:hypothetical protein
MIEAQALTLIYQFIYGKNGLKLRIHYTTTTRLNLHSLVSKFTNFTLDSYWLKQVLSWCC